MPTYVKLIYPVPIFAVPIYPGLTAEMQEYAVVQIREFYLGK